MAKSKTSKFPKVVREPPGTFGGARGALLGGLPISPSWANRLPRLPISLRGILYMIRSWCFETAALEFKETEFMALAEEDSRKAAFVAKGRRDGCVSEAHL